MDSRLRGNDVSKIFIKEQLYYLLNKVEPSQVDFGSIRQSKLAEELTMIHFNPETRTFNLLLHSSVYAMQVDNKDRLIHLA